GAGAAGRTGRRVDAAELARLMEQNGGTVVDLSLSRDYRKGHIPGAWFAIRSRLDRALPVIAPQGTMVLTSEDGIVAALALDEMTHLTPLPVRHLGGGNAAWAGSGRPLPAAGPRPAGDAAGARLK